MIVYAKIRASTYTCGSFALNNTLYHKMCDIFISIVVVLNSGRSVSDMFNNKLKLAYVTTVT